MTHEPWLSTIRLVLPAKSLSSAKSRLGLRDRERKLVATYLLQHTLSVALECLPAAHVSVLTKDARLSRVARASGVGTLGDAGGGLNLALEGAVDTLRAVHPEDTVVVLVADLPRLSPAALRSALLSAARSTHPRHIADHHGSGTTLISLPPRVVMPMLFGTDSARRFRDAGAEPIAAPPEIVHDLDVLSDLPRALVERAAGRRPSRALAFVRSV